MPKFEGCVEAKEISLTRKGANQHAHVLVRKTAAPAARPQPENKLMPQTDAEKAAAARNLEISKIALAQTNKIAAMSDVTKAHYLGLDADAQLAFLEKASKDMDDEAAEAAAAAKQKSDSEAAKAAGATAREQELQKRLDTQASEIEALKAAQVDRDLEKRASDEFAGYPGGAAAVVPLLKAYATLPEDARKASEELLKTQAKLASQATKAFGNRSEEEVSKADAAKTRIDEAAQKMAEQEKIPLSKAWEKTIEKAEFAADVEAMNQAA